MKNKSLDYVLHYVIIHVEIYALNLFPKFTKLRDLYSLIKRIFPHSIPYTFKHVSAIHGNHSFNK